MDESARVNMDKHDAPHQKGHSRFRHIAKHISRLCRRQETVSEAGAKILTATQRLAKGAFSPHAEARHRQAVDCVQQGVKHYNAKRYDAAEEAFRKALDFDEEYGRAHLYLGNALYKRQQHQQGVWHWRRTVEVEPHSAAAEAARKKLAHIEEQGNLIITELKNRLNGR